MSEPIITNTFPKQPREVRWCQVRFDEALQAHGDTARVVDPIEVEPLAAGPGALVLEQQVFDPATNRLNLLVSGGVDGERYTITMWIYTTSGQKLEHQISVRVKELG